MPFTLPPLLARPGDEVEIDPVTGLPRVPLLSNALESSGGFEMPAPLPPPLDFGADEGPPDYTPALPPVVSPEQAEFAGALQAAAQPFADTVGLAQAAGYGAARAAELPAREQAVRDAADAPSTARFNAARTRVLPELGVPPPVAPEGPIVNPRQDIPLSYGATIRPPAVEPRPGPLDALGDVATTAFGYAEAPAATVAGLTTSFKPFETAAAIRVAMAQNGGDFFQAVRDVQRARPGLERLVTEFAADPLNLIGIGLERQAATAIAGAVKRTGRIGVEAVEAVSEAGGRAAASVARGAETLPAPAQWIEPMGGAAEGPLRRRVSSQAAGGGYAAPLRAADAELERMAAEADALLPGPAQEAHFDRMFEVQSRRDALSDIGEEAGRLQSEIDGLNATLDELPGTKYWNLIARQGAFKGEVPETLSPSQYYALTHQTPRNVSRNAQGRIPTHIALDTPADEAGMTTDELIASIHEARDVSLKAQGLQEKLRSLDDDARLLAAQAPRRTATTAQGPSTLTGPITGDAGQQGALLGEPGPVPAASMAPITPAERARQRLAARMIGALRGTPVPEDVPAGVEHGFSGRIRTGEGQPQAVQELMQAAGPNVHDVRDTATALGAAQRRVAANPGAVYDRLLAKAPERFTDADVFDSQALTQHYGALADALYETDPVAASRAAEQAVSVAYKADKAALELGRGVQAFSGWDNLSPERRLRYAAHVLREAGETVGEGRVTARLSEAAQDIEIEKLRMANRALLTRVDELARAPRTKPERRIAAAVEKGAPIAYKDFLSDMRKLLVDPFTQLNVRLVPDLSRLRPLRVSQYEMAADDAARFFEKGQATQAIPDPVARSEAQKALIKEMDDFVAGQVSDINEGRRAERVIQRLRGDITARMELEGPVLSGEQIKEAGRAERAAAAAAEKERVARLQEIARIEAQGKREAAAAEREAATQLRAIERQIAAEARADERAALQKRRADIRALADIDRRKQAELGREIARLRAEANSPSARLRADIISRLEQEGPTLPPGQLKEVQHESDVFSFLTDRDARAIRKRIMSDQAKAEKEIRATVRATGTELPPNVAIDLLRRFRAANDLPAGSPERFRATQEGMGLIRNLVPATRIAQVMTALGGYSRVGITMWDFSAPFRQGRHIGARHPLLWAKAYGPMLKAFKSGDFAAEVDALVHTHPVMQREGASKLYLADRWPGTTMSRSEEQWFGRAAGSTTGWKRYLGPDASQDAYITFLNKLRVDVFSKWVDDIEAAGGTLTPDDIGQLAESINLLTGRGKLGPLDRSGNVLAQVLFAPRYLAASIERPFQMASALGSMVPGAQRAGPRFAYSNPAVARKVAGTYGAYLGMGMTSMGLAALAGADVQMDPLASNFGGVSWGPLRFNIWQDDAALMTLLGRVATGKTRTSYGNEAPADALETVGDFLVGKMSPLGGTVKALIPGQRMFGGADIGAGVPSSGNLSNIEQITGLPLTAALGKMGGYAEQVTGMYVPATLRAFMDGYTLSGTYGGATGALATGIGSGIGVKASAYQNRLDYRNEEAQRSFGKNYLALNSGDRLKVDASEFVVKGDATQVEYPVDPQVLAQSGRKFYDDGKAAQEKKLAEQLTNPLRHLSGKEKADAIRDFKAAGFQAGQLIFENEVVKATRNVKTDQPVEDILRDRYWGAPLENPQTGELDYRMRDAIRQKVLDEAGAQWATYVKDPRYDTRYKNATVRAAIMEYDRDMETLRPYYDKRDEVERQYPQYAAAKKEVERMGGQRVLDDALYAAPQGSPQRAQLQSLRNLYVDGTAQVEIERENLRLRDHALEAAGVKWMGWQPVTRSGQQAKLPRTSRMERYGTPVPAGVR